MRKFKVKNRQKRKYIRQHSAASSFYQPDLIITGLLPLILIVGAYLVTISRNNFVFPEVAIDLSQPQIDSTGIRGLSALMNQLFSNFTVYTIDLFSTLLTGLSTTNAGALKGTSHAVIIISNALTHFFQTMTFFFQSILGIIITVFNFVVGIMQDMVYAIVAFIQTFTDGVLTFIKISAESISSVYHAVVRAITSPFIQMSKYIAETKPFFVFVGSKLKPAVNDLEGGLNNLLLLFNEISKNSS